MAAHGLFMGINNYPGAHNDLQGCVNDARDLSEFFAQTLSLGSSEVLLNSQVKKRVMCRYLRSTLEACGAGDLAVITFSGHGTWIPDRNGDEPDGREECFVPYDHQRFLLPDDEVRHYLVKHRHPEAHVLLITDCCHSGTIFRAFGSAGGPLRPRFMPPSRVLGGVRDALKGSDIKDVSIPEMERLADRVRAKTNKPLPGVIHLSGCRDVEYSYDAVFDGRPNGALTYVALNAYRETLKLKSPTYEKWHERIRRRLPSAQHPQTPQLNARKEDKTRPLLSQPKN